MTIDELYEELGRLRDKSLGAQELKVEVDTLQSERYTAEISFVSVYENGNVVLSTDIIEVSNNE